MTPLTEDKDMNLGVPSIFLRIFYQIVLPQGRRTVEPMRVRLAGKNIVSAPLAFTTISLPKTNKFSQSPLRYFSCKGKSSEVR